MKKLINWSELSLKLGLDRNAIRGNKRIPRKHFRKIDKIFYNDLPSWWEKIKSDETDNEFKEIH